MAAVREILVCSGTHSHYPGSISDPRSMIVVRSNGNGKIIKFDVVLEDFAVMQERCFGRRSHSYVALLSQG